MNMGVQIRKEHMRVANGPGTSERQIDVHNPFTNEICGTVPRASVAEIEQAFRAAKAFKPELSRSQRSEILRKTADLLVARRQEIAELITAESGLCLKDTIYEVGRAYDVFFLSSTAVIKDDGE
ncbi:MAG TPA: aldehyde dehydrogenase family protein, partial [Dongiaceae bacterium]|nr:aldehyde dehydrogenase family protein [Dongiaceae bacterium]